MMLEEMVPVTVQAEDSKPVPAVAPPIWGEVAMKKYEPDKTAWLITCVDLTSLLVGFFVLLFSTQTLKQDKWQQVTGSFHEQFANAPHVVPVVPDGGNNAVVRVAVVKSGLAYLDTLFHQRVQGDAVWSGLKAEVEGGRQEMAYALPGDVLVEGPAADEAWARLGSVLRGWKNPVGIRVTTTRAQLAAEGARAVALSSKLAKSGVMNVFADLTVDERVTQAQVRLVVRAE